MSCNTPDLNQSQTCAPDFLTAQQVAEKLQVSTDTVIRLFSGLDGVVDLGHSEDTRKHKRRYRLLRIPHATYAKFCRERGAR